MLEGTGEVESRGEGRAWLYGNERRRTTGEGRGRGGEVAAAHGFRWKYEKTHPDQAFSVMDFLRRKQYNIPPQCLTALITSLRPGMRVPGKALLRREVIVYLILALDLEPFVPKTRGCFKPSLPTKWLRNAAHAWRQYHPMKKKEELPSCERGSSVAPTTCGRRFPSFAAVGAGRRGVIYLVLVRGSSHGGICSRSDMP